ncbi:hypothetical protein RRG08_001542 [Elysia crispata]|uniref:Reverse transcriptase domain-containing protein n=1 Tax=Elysia crispata TaxID=231223 RepID=A0AAE1DZX6_9GAST|nr:hypothetical protein RRG08_001542 [Elysia crispata]
MNVPAPSLDLSSTAFSSHDQEQLNNLVKEYADVMARSELDLGHYKGVEYTIELEDPMPFKQRYRRIPPHMFEEKDGKLRLCVDYRLLNSRTRKDNYCLLRVDEILDSLRGAKYFSRLDLKSDYHLISIREDHKPYTAFTVGPLGFWEHNRLAFGLCNSQGTFQRVMEDCFSDLNLRIIYIYIDDIILFSETSEEHLKRLSLVFQRLRDFGLELSLQKCAFAQSQVRFPGHFISADGGRPDSEKIAKVKDWPSPQNPKELRSFLGFAGYYRKFVEKYSEFARPLNSLLPPTRKKIDKGPSKVTKWEWEDKHEQSFQCLKNLLCAAPLLAYADFTKPFELHIDASTVGLGAVTLSTKLDATDHRWLAALAAFDFEIEYTPGVSNQDADALSRLPSGRIDIASVQAMCSVDFAPFAATMAVFAEKTEEETSPFPHISLTELRQAQNVDEILGVWMAAMGKRECPILKRTPNPAKYGIMKKNWQKFCFYRGLLHRKIEGESPQLVLPTKYIPTVCIYGSSRTREDPGPYKVALFLARNVQRCRKLGSPLWSLCVEKSRTTPFYRMGNGSCDRMNQTLISLLGTLPEREKKDWTSWHVGSRI